MVGESDQDYYPYKAWEADSLMTLSFAITGLKTSLTLGIQSPLARQRSGLLRAM